MTSIKEDKSTTNDETLKIILLNNGDEVLCETFDTDDKEVICFKNPLVISRVDSGNGFNIVLNKWIPYSNDFLFPVNKNTIITQSNTSENIKNFYISYLTKILEKDIEKEEVTIEITDDKRKEYLDKNIILH